MATHLLHIPLLQLSGCLIFNIGHLAYPATGSLQALHYNNSETNDAK